MKKLMKMYNMKISIIGSGIVGASTGIGLSKLGNGVIFYDVDKKRVQNLIDSNRCATTQIGEAIAQSDISFVSVPTPFDGKQMDLSYIRSAVSDMHACIGPCEKRIDIGSPLSYVKALDYLVKLITTKRPLR